MWAGFPAGGVLASLVSLVLLDSLGWRWMFYVGLIPLFVFVPFMIRYLPESPAWLLAKGRVDEANRVAAQAGIENPEPPVLGEKVGPRALFTRHAYLATLLLGLLSACGLLLTYALNTWLPKLMQNAGFGIDSALTFLLVLNAGAIVVPLIASRASDRIGPQIVTASAFGAAAISILLISLNVPTGLLYVLTFVAGAGTIGAQVLVYGFAAAHFPASSRAAGTAWVASVGRVGGIAGPSLVGLIVAGGAGVEVNFYVFAAIAVIGSAAALAVPRKRTTTSTAQTVTTAEVG